MKRAIFLTLCLLALAACTARPPADATPPAAESHLPVRPLPTVSEQPAPGAIVWTVQPFTQDFTAADGTPVLSAEFSLPAIENPAGHAPWTAVNDFYAAEGERLLEDAREQALWAVDDYAVASESGFPFDCYAMTQTCVISMETDAFISIVRTGTLSGGDLPEESWVFAEQFDPATGRRMNFADFFTVLSSAAQARVLEQLERLCAESPLVSDSALIVRHYAPERFYLTDAEFAVYFNPGELSDDRRGSPVFLIPYDALRDLMIAW